MKGNQKILVVDDEDVILQMFKDICSELDLEIEVMTAGNVDEAEEILDKQSEFPAIVFCDLYMPRRNGLELLEIFKEKYPQVPFWMMSGGNPDGTKNGGLFSEAANISKGHFLVKPIDIKVLISIFQENGLIEGS